MITIRRLGISQPDTDRLLRRAELTTDGGAADMT